MGDRWSLNLCGFYFSPRIADCWPDPIITPLLYLHAEPVFTWVLAGLMATSCCPSLLASLDSGFGPFGLWPWQVSRRGVSNSKSAPWLCLPWVLVLLPVGWRMVWLYLGLVPLVPSCTWVGDAGGEVWTVLPQEDSRCAECSQVCMQSRMHEGKCAPGWVVYFWTALWDTNSYLF